MIPIGRFGCSEPNRRRRIDIVWAFLVRARTGLSQVAFAAAVGLPVKTWRNWEQGRTRIEPAGIALLRLLDADPIGARDNPTSAYSRTTDVTEPTTGALFATTDASALWAAKAADVSA